MKQRLLQCYRQLPWFKGKLRIGKFFFKKYINQSAPLSFYAHYNIGYKIPNTLENIGVELLINGIYEKEIIDFLNTHVESGDIYFDIGANIGAVGLPVVKARQNIRYYGFEASPTVFEYLQCNFIENKIDTYELHNYLVHKDDNQSMKFYQSALYGKSSLSPTYSDEYVAVNSLSLDRFCEDRDISGIDWMKVDVQGYELFVFEGMHNLLRNKMVSNILFEFEPWAEEQAGLRIGIAKDYIHSMGYSLFTLDGQNWEEHKKEKDTMIWAKPNSGK
ncbi:MAG: FkbM family methyltransferase [Ferruginibacter sp.]|nr:FkbM family methyltransferase [Ferruginibacter sp.]